MRPLLLAVLGTALLLPVARLDAQFGGRRPVRTAPRGPLPPAVLLYATLEDDAVGRVLERADSLGLTDDQVARLRALRREARRANRTIADSLQRLGIERPSPETPPARELTPEQKAAIAPLEAAARDNNRLARETALGYLTETQRARFTEWERRIRPGAARDSAPARRPPPGGRFSR